MEIFWGATTHQEWERLCDQALAPMGQRWDYGAVHAALGGQVHRAVIRHNNTPIALCQCLSRKIGGVINVSLASRGPVWLTECNQKQVLALIRRTLPIPRPRVGLFSLATPLSSARIVPLMTPATFAQCALPITKGDLHTKWRNALKKADKFKIEIQHGTCNLPALNKVLSIDTMQQKTGFYRALPPEFTQRWHRLRPQNLHLYTAREKGENIASAVFLRHGNTATYHIASTSDRGRKTSAGRLLLWRAFQEFSKNNVGCMDLGLIDTENAPGLARFKLGAGAQAHQMGPSVLAL